MISTTEEQLLALALSQTRQELTRLVLRRRCASERDKAAFDAQHASLQQQIDELDRRLDAPERDSA